MSYTETVVFTCSKEDGNTRAIFEIFSKLGINSANIYLFKVNNRKTGEKCEILSELIKTPPEQRY